MSRKRSSTGWLVKLGVVAALGILGLYLFAPEHDPKAAEESAAAAEPPAAKAEETVIEAPVASLLRGNMGMYAGKWVKFVSAVDSVTSDSVELKGYGAKVHCQREPMAELGHLRPNLMVDMIGRFVRSKRSGRDGEIWLESCRLAD